MTRATDALSDLRCVGCGGATAARDLSVCAACGPQDPVARFVFDYGWGDLQDHWQDCEDCAGTGKDESDGSGPPDDCATCDGHGRWRWGSFYEADTGECAFCEGKDLRVAEMFEGGGRDGEGWICLPCYVMRHHDECGCSSWNAAEKAAPIRSEDR